MSKRRLFSSLAVVAGALFLTARFAVMIFPISAPAQEVARGGDHLLHHAPIVYPTEAIEKRIEGTVIVSATIDDHGSVTDARVVSGPDALRRAALRSVLDWHYGADTPSPVEVAIDFHLPVKGQTATSPSQLPAPSFQPGVVKYVRYAGVSSAIRDEVARRLAVREGDPYAADTLDRARQSARDVDEHLVVSSMRLMPPSDPSEYLLTVSYASANTPQRIRVGGNVQDAQVINKVKPPYPPQAKAARIQGVVKLNVLIGRDGTVENVELVSGPPELVQVAMDAVRQWTYKPTLLNGNPVEVATVVDINFTLAQ